MSILKTTHSGSKAIPVTSGQEILDEIAKLGYTFDYDLKCWVSNEQLLPAIEITHFPNIIVRAYITKYNATTFNIFNMSDVFNFIDYLKEKYVNS